MAKIGDIQLVVFDWNGTLIDDFSGMFSGVQEIFRRFGVTVPLVETYQEEITADIMQFYWAHGIPRTATVEELNAILREVFGQLGPTSYPLRKDALMTLDRLRHRSYNLALVSAGDGVKIQEQLGYFGISSHFTRIATDARNKAQALLETAEFFGVAPKKAIYVDDTAKGLVAAKSADFRTCGVYSGYNSIRQIREVKPDMFLAGDDLASLPLGIWSFPSYK